VLGLVSGVAPSSPSGAHLQTLFGGFVAVNRRQGTAPSDYSGLPVWDRGGGSCYWRLDSSVGVVLVGLQA